MQMVSIVAGAAIAFAPIVQTASAEDSFFTVTDVEAQVLSPQEMRGVVGKAQRFFVHVETNGVNQEVPIGVPGGGPSDGAMERLADFLFISNPPNVVEISIVD